MFAIVLLGIGTVFAHPGHNVADEAADRAEFFKSSPKSVRSCASQLSQRDTAETAITRRKNLASEGRSKRNLVDKFIISRHDFAEYSFTHVSTEYVTLGNNELRLFEDNSTCVLQPEVTQGPYYIEGENIRSNVTEDQQGVPLYLDIQLIDTSTCEVVPAVFVEIWHCNATGVYSGVSASGNGNSNDTTNLNNTFLRGIQPTDVNGVVQFETIFPGH